jgi:hypothetical protein
MMYQTLHLNASTWQGSQLSATPGILRQKSNFPYYSFIVYSAYLALPLLLGDNAVFNSR